MDTKNREQQPQPKANWTNSPRAVPEGEPSEFTVSQCPNPVALSLKAIEAKRRLEAHVDRECVFMIMRENSLKSVAEFNPFIVEAFRTHRADLPQHALVVLESNGGCARDAFELARFFQQVCESHIVVIPKRAMSAATLFALSADEIFLAPEAHCGPCDMQLNGRSSLSITRDKDYVQDVLAGIAQAIRAFDHDKQRPFAETGELLSHVQAATNVPKLAGEWSDAKEGMLAVIDYVIELLKANDYTQEEAKDIAWKLCTEYHDHSHPLFFDQLKSIGLRVHLLDRETQGLVDALMKTLPLFPVVGVLKHLDYEKPSESPHHGPKPHRFGEADPSRDGTGAGTPSSPPLEEEA